MIIHEVEQGSDAWLDLRLGKATASRFKDILAVTKSGSESAARAKYRAELVAERLTGRSPERYRSPAMEFGAETEETARISYSLQTGNLVDRGPFYELEGGPVGASPDGLVGDHGLIEIKCYELHNHIAALRSGHMPLEHKPQVQGQLWIAERRWCDFISFAPELPENAQLFVERIERDDAYIAELAIQVAQFVAEVNEEVQFVKNYGIKKEVKVG